MTDPLNDEFFKLPRLYIDADFAPNASVAPSEQQAHYLKNVLRMKPGEMLRVFNGRDGEFLARFEAAGKHTALALTKKIKDQPPTPAPVHLLFAVLKKKDRMDVLVEKAVELGVTDIHPVLTARTEIRKINEERVRTQIFEAAEQCERFEIPILHPLADLKSKIAGWNTAVPVFWCRERGESPHISTLNEKSWAFLIGPEGGFDNNEFAFLGGVSQVRPVSLGAAVLRAETAMMLALGYAKITGGK